MDPEPIAARHEAVLERLTQLARDDDRIVAAWLQGSRADGSADAFSDIDFYVAVSDDAYEGFDKLAFIEQAAPVLVHAGLFGLNAAVCLLEGPVKLDLFVERAAAAPVVGRPSARMLVNKAGLALQTGWEPSDADVARHVDGVVRVTLQGASWPVRLLRRGQWMTQAFSELTLIHSVIVPLMLVRHDRRAFQRNQMTRERLRPDADRAEVDRLAREVLHAMASRSPAHAYRAHMGILELFGRAGRAACTTFGLTYPEAAEQEAIRFYEREWPR